MTRERTAQLRRILDAKDPCEVSGISGSVCKGLIASTILARCKPSRQRRKSTLPSVLKLQFASGIQNWLSLPYLRHFPPRTRYKLRLSFS